MLPVRHLILLALALFVIACGGGGSGSGGADDEDPGDTAARSLLVRWRTSADVEGYVIHWGHTSGQYTEALDVGMPEPDASGVLSFLLEQTGPPGTIFFALTSYDASGEMSSFSNEISAAVP